MPPGSSNLAVRTALGTFELSECTQAGILEAGTISDMLNISR